MVKWGQVTEALVLPLGPGWSSDLALTAFLSFRTSQERIEPEDRSPARGMTPPPESFEKQRPYVLLKLGQSIP